MAFCLQVCTPYWHPKLTFILAGEDGQAEDEALRGLENCFSDLS